MNKLFLAVGIAATFVTSGCSIHPLPEDVTGVSTYHIVRQIRCEARDTLKKIVIKFLGRLNDPLAQQLRSSIRPIQRPSTAFTTISSRAPRSFAFDLL